jgi:hypothetical protein
MVTLKVSPAAFVYTSSVVFSVRSSSPTTLSNSISIEPDCGFSSSEQEVSKIKAIARTERNNNDETGSAC